VRSAFRQFAKHGFDQVTVEDIAADCEVSPRTFFRYFASKEEVLFAESDGHRIHLLQALADQDFDVSPFRGLECAIRMIAADYAAQGDVLRIRHQIVTSTASLRTRAAERQQRWESEVVEHLRASGRAQNMSDLDLRFVVASSTTALRVAIEAWIATDGSQDLDTLLGVLFDLLRQGLDR